MVIARSKLCEQQQNKKSSSKLLDFFSFLRSSHFLRDKKFDCSICLFNVGRQVGRQVDGKVQSPYLCYLHKVYTLILHFFKNNIDIRKRTDVSVVSYLMHRLHKIIFLKLKQCSKCIFLCAIRLSTEICYYFV